MTHPTDALRLVPLETAQHAANNMRIAYHKTRMTREVPVSPDDLSVVLDFVKQAAPASPLPEGGGPHQRWGILNHLGGFWTPENFDTERQAAAYLDRWKRDNPKMDLSKHKVIPVLVTMTAAPTGEPK